MIRPYIIISLAGILAFAPVSFMLNALKNDIIALEYPINHFMSQCIRNGEIPYWFNTWGMGFPLQSNITWGLFSTPQLFFSALFDYNIYSLHIEFMFFILLSGWGMFYLLKTHFLNDERIAQLLAICYMLSGFMCGSTQWLLYITAASFIPLILSSLLSLLKEPSVKKTVQFSIVYTLMFTSVYAAFNIITTYSLFAFIICWLIQSKKKTRISRYLILTALLTTVLCLPCLYFTLEVLNHIQRGSAINSDSVFFNSNYLPPSSLGNMLLPLTAVKMKFPNTEGTMFGVYSGLFILMVLPASISQVFITKNRVLLASLGASFIFLVLSFGDITPLREILNILPGFSYFRNPGIFRFYFILLLIIFTAQSLKEKSLKDILSGMQNKVSIYIVYTLGFLFLLYFTIFLFNIREVRRINLTSVTIFLKQITLSQSVFISALIQLIIVTLLFAFIKKRSYSLCTLILTVDLIINTLFCTPFFSVSSYSVKEVNELLKSAPGFPIQQENLNAVKAVLIDNKKNPWHNINTFNKKISSNESYRGPLTLNNYTNVKDNKEVSDSFFSKSLAYFEGLSANEKSKVILQNPTHIKIEVKLEKPKRLTVMQNEYPGWKAYYNNEELPLLATSYPGISVMVPEGTGIAEIKYNRPSILISAIVLHVIVLLFLLAKLSIFIKNSYHFTLHRS